VNIQVVNDLPDVPTPNTLYILVN